MRERTVLLGHTDEGPVAVEPLRLDAAVLKVNQQSARVRALGEAGQMTFRSRDVGQIVPGHLVTLSIEKRWRCRSRLKCDRPGADTRADTVSFS